MPEEDGRTARARDRETAMSVIHSVISDAGIFYVSRQNAIDRIHEDPGIPDAENTTSSFWLKQPHPTLATTRSSEFPKETDVVIIGSGITDASVAHTLLQQPGSP